jgi:hypothetical protein
MNHLQYLDGDRRFLGGIEATLFKAL